MQEKRAQRQVNQMGQTKTQMTRGRRPRERRDGISCGIGVRNPLLLYLIGSACSRPTKRPGRWRSGGATKDIIGRKRSSASAACICSQTSRWYQALLSFRFAPTLFVKAEDVHAAFEGCFGYVHHVLIQKTRQASRKWAMTTLRPNVLLPPRWGTHDQGCGRSIPGIRKQAQTPGA